MNRKVTLCAVVGLLMWGLGKPAWAWIISKEEEQVSGVDVNAFEVKFAGNVRVMGGGQLAGTNAFSNPLRRNYTTFPTPTNVTFTGVRYLSITKAVISDSPGVKRQFGLFGDGPAVPVIWDEYWSVDTNFQAATPAPSVTFEHVDATTVAVTIVNMALDEVSVSQVGYRLLKTNSFNVTHLNRKLMPPSAFAASGVADGTVLTAGDGAGGAGGSVSFNVSGVGFDDDIIVYLTADFSPTPTAPAAIWVAWRSGTFVPARMAYRGRTYINALNVGARAVGATVAHGDLAAKTPFKTIVAVKGPDARFLPVMRKLYDPGWCVPIGENDPATPGCNPAFGTAAEINANLTDLVLSTTNPGDEKLGYLRTDGQDWYTDVRVRARIMPGASTTTTNAAASDDFGGPVAIRVQPTGGSYYASVVTGQKNQISLMMDSVDGLTQTPLATATQWSNGDPIALDNNVPSPMKLPNSPPLYVPRLYDVTLQAIGATLTLTVDELSGTTVLHTLTLTAVEGSYTQGYVGLRVDRNWAGGAPSDGTGDISVQYETMVRNYVIEDPHATVAMCGDHPCKAILPTNMEPSLDDPNADDGTLSDQRSGEVLSDHAAAEMLIDLGYAVDEVDVDIEVDNFSYSGAWADFADPSGRFWPPVNGNYDLLWMTGGAASSASKYAMPRLTMPVVVYENGDIGERRCDGNSPIPPPPGDPCGGFNADAGLGSTGGGTGDWRGSGTAAWGGNLYAPPDSIRILKASGDPSGTNGDPAHPIVAGLGDANGVVKVYAEGWRHTQTAGNPMAPGTVDLAVELNAENGADGVVNSHPAWGLLASETGGVRAWASGIAPHGPNETFPARNSWLYIGDAMFHRLTPAGRELARRAAYWVRGLSIPASPWMNYGDYDEDGDVDLADFSHFQTCFNGPNRPYSFENGCADADIDGDGDVDLVDFSSFQACFNGPNRPPNAGCPTPPISIPGDL
jgi:hypothetical protein